MPTTKRTLDELAGLGGDILDRLVRPVLRPEDDSKFVAIDVETGDYEIDEDDYAVIGAPAVAETGGRYLADAGGLPGNVSDRGVPMIQGVVNARHEAIVRISSWLSEIEAELRRIGLTQYIIPEYGTTRSRRRRRRA